MHGEKPTAALRTSSWSFLCRTEGGLERFGELEPPGEPPGAATAVEAPADRLRPQVDLEDDPPPGWFRWAHLAGQPPAM
jgi:hypothetical protein